MTEKLQYVGLKIRKYVRQEGGRKRERELESSRKNSEHGCPSCQLEKKTVLILFGGKEHKVGWQWEVHQRVYYPDEFESLWNQLGLGGSGKIWIKWNHLFQHFGCFLSVYTQIPRLSLLYTVYKLLIPTNLSSCWLKPGLSWIMLETFKCFKGI